jgi:hypothetical protein
MLKRLTIVLILAMTMAVAAQADSETTVNGFVDASYLYNNNAAAGEFGLDQVELDVMHAASEKTSLRADLEWVKNGNVYDVQVEQAFMTYHRDCGTSIMFGQFNAPIGFELLDAPDMYQFSHSLVFDNGLPTNLTGVAVMRDLSDAFDIVVYGCNGWDQNTEDNKNLTFGGRLGYTCPGDANLGLSAISGKEGSGNAAMTRTVFDVDASYASGAWTFGGEYNMGKVEMVGGAEADWSGFLVMSHYDFNDWAGFTVRYDNFDDPDGYAFGLATGQTRSSLTLCPTFVLDDGFGCLVELRMDMSDEEVFLDSDGAATDSETSVAFEMTYSW